MFSLQHSGHRFRMAVVASLAASILVVVGALLQAVSQLQSFS